VIEPFGRGDFVLPKSTTVACEMLKAFLHALPDSIICESLSSQVLQHTIEPLQFLQSLKEPSRSTFGCIMNTLQWMSHLPGNSPESVSDGFALCFFRIQQSKNDYPALQKLATSGRRMVVRLLTEFDFSQFGKLLDGSLESATFVSLSGSQISYSPQPLSPLSPSASTGGPLSPSASTGGWSKTLPSSYKEGQEEQQKAAVTLSRSSSRQNIAAPKKTPPTRLPPTAKPRTPDSMTAAPKTPRQLPSVKPLPIPTCMKGVVEEQQVTEEHQDIEDQQTSVTQNLLLARTIPNKPLPLPSMVKRP